METLWQDLKYATRMLAKSPGFAAVAVLTLALGIGANTAIFSIVNAVLFRPLPFPSAGRLAMVYVSFPALGFPKITLNAPTYLAFVADQKSFESVGIYSSRHYDASGVGQPERISGARVSATLFPTLGVEPALGRSFTPEEDAPGHRVAILSHGLWKRKFGGDREVLGRTILLDRNPYTIIGVMPEKFQFPMQGPAFNSNPADVWVPMAFSEQELKGVGSMYNHSVIGRLKPGVSAAQASAEAEAIGEEIQKTFPPELTKAIANTKVGLFVMPMHSEVVGTVQMPMLVLLVAVGLVLLIGCANVANLLLARATVRHKEIAIRTALGAGRGRVLRQMLTESLLLSVAGGLAGLVFAVWAQRVLVALSPADLPRAGEIGFNGAVFSFTAAISLLTAIIFGLAPALESTRTDIYDALKASGRGTASGRSRRMQNVFVVAQMALAILLLSGAGLLVRSFIRLLETDPGFRPEHVVTMSVPLPFQAYSNAGRIRETYREILERVSSIPGVKSAALSSDLPLEREEIRSFEIEGRNDFTSATPPSVTQTWTLGDYFGTMQISLKSGRGFSPEDRLGAPLVMLISESMARKYWPKGDSIGKRIRWSGDDEWMTIVGIVADVKDASLRDDTMPHTYTPWVQEVDSSLETRQFSEIRTLDLSLRANGDPAALVGAARREIEAVDSQLVVGSVQTMNAAVAKSVAPERFSVSLLLAFALSALFLAAVGIYGVLSYAVTQRMHEMGIRITLGAQTGDITRLVVGQGMRLAIFGAALGLAGSLVLARYIRSLLYGVSAWDPATLFTATGVLLGVALIACYMPARRATRIDPLQAMRYE